MISPLLAKINLHYVLDLWTRQWRERHARGDVIVVRYADDSVVGFRTQWQAQQFLGQLQERLAKFGLSLNASKTRLIEFGRFAARNRRSEVWVNRRHLTSWASRTDVVLTEAVAFKYCV
ncbi:reverse transcriptase domain-containing protein [Pseudomonas putida]|uniref:reverse transcriptase domain-containing protein n=1 Tax=Pseudomonas putida TaxID=303 RepID=UPI001EE8426C|nr:reverse transcriptase domain-containing protein [Pseudomonas putida]